VNVDGTGAAWWVEGRAEPLRYVTDKSPWADPNLSDLAPVLSGTPLLAAVRSATPGIPHGPQNVAPFVSGGLAAVHNGWIGGFRKEVGRFLLDKLSEDRFSEIDSMNDSLVLFHLVNQQIDDEPGIEISDAMAEVFRFVAKTVIAEDRAAALNLVVASDSKIVAARTSAGTEINSLYTLKTGGGNWVASEPLDDTDPWESVPDHSLVVLTKESVEVLALDHEGVG
jgi:glutamine amidotransferase